MKGRKTVIMAEFSDVRYDARVLKEAKHLANKNFLVILYMYHTDIEKNVIYKNGNITYHIYSFINRRRNDSIIGVTKKYVEALFFLIHVNIRILMSRADYYHAHNLKFLFFFFISSILHNGKLIYDAHELHSEHYDNSKTLNRVRNKMNLALERLVLLKCHAFIQASEERANYISKKLGINKPIVINNYVPIYKISQEKKYDLKMTLKINNDYPILFYSGGVYDDRLIAFEKILGSLATIKKVNLVIVGFMNNDIKIRLEKTITTFGLLDRVFLLGPVPNDKIVQFASSADIGLIPLTGESINTKLSALNKISEYLMSGLPLLCSNYDNLNKIVNDNPVGKVGDVFDVNSSISISTSIQKMINIDYYKSLRSNALLLAHKYYNWNNEIKKLDYIYATND